MSPPPLAQTSLQLFRQLRDTGAGPADIRRWQDDYDVAVLLLGARLRGSGKPFLCHLVGTASALILEGAPPALARAGLLHAAYSHGRFADGLSGATSAHRAFLAARIGDAVEAQIHAYTEFRFDRALLDAVLTGPATPAEPLRALLLMRICNEVDDTLDYAGALGGKARYGDPGWLVQVAAVARRIKADGAAARLDMAARENQDVAWLGRVPAAAPRPNGETWRSRTLDAARMVRRRIKTIAGGHAS